MKQILTLLITLGMVSALISCGGSGTDGTPATGSRGSGTVGILLTDKPADPSLFSSINASIESIELLGGDDNGRVTLYSGVTKTFDLLRLRNEAIPFTFQDDVPSGSYCKIRLTLSDLELVLADDTPEDSTDNETYHPRLPGNGKLDLVARNCFTVGAGEVVTIQLDIDAGNSIHINENNNGFNFRPVVFVDILEQGFEARLVRLEGIITEVDDEQKTLLLCEAIPTQDLNSKGCVDVYFDADSAFFDNLEYSGAPRALAELLTADKLDQAVTVVGRPRYLVKPYLDVEVPEGHFPPPGECRLWNINLEAGQQPPPISCDDVPANLPDDTVVVTHEGVQKDPFHPLMAVNGVVVELGEFLQVEGAVATDADTSGFGMSVTLGGPVISADILSVMFQQGTTGVNGTRIVSRSGELLTPADIIVPLAVQVDGVAQPITNSDPVLNAALIIIDTDLTATQQVTGTVLTAGTELLTLALDNDTICGQVTDTLDVNLTTNVDILTVIITSQSSEIIPGGQLEAGQLVGMNGHCTTSGYQTDNVVIVDDQRI